MVSSSLSTDVDELLCSATPKSPFLNDDDGGGTVAPPLIDLDKNADGRFKIPSGNEGDDDEDPSAAVIQKNMHATNKDNDIFSLSLSLSNEKSHKSSSHSKHQL
jgi:hypothetical protein